LDLKKEREVKVLFRTQDEGDHLKRKCIEFENIADDKKISFGFIMKLNKRSEAKKSKGKKAGPTEGIDA